MCVLEHGKDARLAEEENTVAGDLPNSMCFLGLGGSRGRVSNDNCFCVEIGCEPSCLHCGLLGERSGPITSLAVAARPSVRI